METAPRSFDPETHGGRDSLWRDVEKGDKALATDAMVTLFFLAILRGENDSGKWWK